MWHKVNFQVVYSWFEFEGFLLDCLLTKIKEPNLSYLPIAGVVEEKK